MTGGAPGSLRAPALAAAIALVPLLGACQADGASRDRLILANVHAAGYPTAEALRGFAAAVEEAEDLAGLAVDLQLGGVLGGEKEVLEKVRFGAVQMYAGSVAPLAEFVEEIGVLTLPYLFRDEDHFWAVLDGPVGEELLGLLEGSGFVGLAWYDAGARSFYDRLRPIRRLDDLRGLKIRVQQSEIMRETVAALGATPVSLSFKQVYTNLQTGTVDGAENNLPSYRSERHFEVAPYFGRDEHSRIPDLLLVRQDTWDRLDPAARDALRRVARQSALAQRRLWSAFETQAREEVTAAGARISEIDDPDAFRDAVAPVYRRFAPRYGDWVERIRAVADEPGAAPGEPSTPVRPPDREGS